MTNKKLNIFYKSLLILAANSFFTFNLYFAFLLLIFYFFYSQPPLLNLNRNEYHG